MRVSVHENGQNPKIRKVDMLYCQHVMRDVRRDAALFDIVGDTE
jgi:hypothetical protein